MKLYVEELKSNTLIEFESEEIARQTLEFLNVDWVLTGTRTLMSKGFHFNSWQDWHPSTHVYAIYSDINYRHSEWLKEIRSYYK